MAGSSDIAAELRARMPAQQAPSDGKDVASELRRRMSPTAAQSIGQAASSFVSGATAALGSILEGVGQAPEMVETTFRAPEGSVSPVGYALRKAGAGLKTVAGKVPTPDNIPAKENFLSSDVPGAFGSTVPFFAGGAVGEAVKLSAWGTSALLGFFSGASNQYADAVAHGVQPGSPKAWGAWLLGGGAGATEALSMGPILSKWNVKTGGRLGALLLAATEEGGQEALQQFLQNEIANGLDYDDRAALEGVGRGAAAGGIVGAILEGLLGFHGGPHQPEASKAPEKPAAPGEAPEQPGETPPPAGPAPTEPEVTPPTAPPAAEAEVVPPFLEDEEEDVAPEVAPPVAPPKAEPAPVAEAEPAPVAEEEVVDEEEAPEPAPPEPEEGPEPDLDAEEEVSPPKATAPPVQPKAGPRLPEELQKSAPRYGWGFDNYEIDFESDLDRALYVVGQKTKSKAHDKFVSWLKDQGWADSDIEQASTKVRARIKDEVRRHRESGNPAKRISVKSGIPQEVRPDTAGGPRLPKGLTWLGTVVGEDGQTIYHLAKTASGKIHQVSPDGTTPSEFPIPSSGADDKLRRLAHGYSPELADGRSYLGKGETVSWSPEMQEVKRGVSEYAQVTRERAERKAKAEQAAHQAKQKARTKLTELHGSNKGWKKGVIPIRVDPKLTNSQEEYDAAPKSKEGLIHPSGLFGIHMTEKGRSGRPASYTLTHMPTGMAASHGLSQADAKVLASRLLSIPGAEGWAESDVDKLTANKELFSNAARVVMAVRNGGAFAPTEAEIDAETDQEAVAPVREEQAAKATKKRKKKAQDDESAVMGRPIRPAERTDTGEIDPNDQLDSQEQVPEVAKASEPGEPSMGGSSVDNLAELAGKTVPAKEGDPDFIGPTMGNVKPQGLVPISRQPGSGRPDMFGTMRDTTAQPGILGRLFNKPVSRTQVMAALAKLVKVVGSSAPIRVGSVMKGALGQYNFKNVVIRLMVALDVPTGAHEVAHAIDFHVFGASKQGPWKAPVVSGVMSRELYRLGKILYGNQKPNGGYKREGFAEFVRLWLTSPETVEREAPNFYAWFNNEFLTKQHRELGEAFDEARDLITTYRMQGSLKRGSSQMPDTESMRYRISQAMGVPLGERFDAITTGWFEVGTPIWRYVEQAREKGAIVGTSNDPATLYETSRLTAGAIADTMATRNTVDIAGNSTGNSLDAALAPVRGKIGDWSLYMYARRAIASWGDKLNPRDPGMSLEDAQTIYDELNSPEFQMAAQGFQEWWDRVLEFTAQHSPWLRQTIVQMKEADPGNYFPLKRVMDEYEKIVRQQPGTKRPYLGALRKGSGRAIKAPIPEILSMTQAFISGAQRTRILEALIELSHTPGMGNMVEDVTSSIADVMPVEHDIQEVLQAIAKQTGMDIDEVAVDAEAFVGQTLTLFAPLRNPKYAGPVIPILTYVQADPDENGNVPKSADGNPKLVKKIKYFHVAPALYDTLQGQDLYRLPKALRWANWMKRTVTLGATALSPRWGLILNPTVDFQTLYMNSQTQAGFARLFTGWVSNMMRAALNQLSGGRYSTPELDFVHNMGLHVAPLLMQDAQQARKAAQRLGHIGKASVSTIQNMSDFNRVALSSGKIMADALGTVYEGVKGAFTFPEVAARATEIGILAKERGYDLKHLTPDQAIELAQAYKQVTIDFTASGKYARAVNSVAPFFNVPFQSLRGSVRSYKRDKGRFVLRGLLSTTVPALLAWWAFKDDERWKDQTARDKFAWVPVPNPFDKENPMRLRYGSEAQMFFGGMMTAMADAAYREDPATMKDFMAVFSESVIPNPLPVPLTLAGEQLANQRLYSGAPIETHSMQEMPHAERFNEYSSKVAIRIGSLAKDLGLPGWMQSPRRIDAAMNGVFPAMEQLLPQVRDTKAGFERERELSDVAVFGALFKPGGMRGNNPQPVRDMYDVLEKARLAHNSKLSPENAEQTRMRLMLEDAAKAVTMLTWMRGRTYNAELRRKLTEEATNISRDALRAVEAPQSAKRGGFHRSAETVEFYRDAMEHDLSKEKGTGYADRRSTKVLDILERN